MSSSWTADGAWQGDYADVNGIMRHSGVTHRIALGAPEEVDHVVEGRLRRAYEANV